MPKALSLHLRVQLSREMYRGVSQQITVSIIGATGYSGTELLRILVRHPRVALGALIAGNSAGRKICEVVPALWGRLDTMVQTYSPDAVAESDLAFIALPSGEAMRIVPELLERGVRVIDLGGDFRLAEAGSYREYYGREHTAPELLPAVYGLPELHRDSVRGKQLVANPGCYPTSAILPLAPLLGAGVVERDGIVICSMSGVSGAGRTASQDFSFCEVNESVRAYRVGRHQHIPEIAAALAASAGGSVAMSFTPHLVPITRGIHTTISARLSNGVGAAEIENVLRESYGSEPFVRLTGSVPPEVKNVAGTNRADIGWHADEAARQLTLLCVIDNLVKGAAGQAVQNMNILFDYEESEGLL